MIGSLHRRIDYLLTHWGNLCPDTISFNKRNRYLIGNYQFPVFHIYFTHNHVLLFLNVSFYKSIQCRASLKPTYLHVIVGM